MTFVMPAMAETITGPAEVVDTDVIKIGDYRIFLFGMESLEEGQTCRIGGANWECWPAAVRALETIASQGEVRCEIRSGPNFLDQAIGQCFVGGDDLSEIMIRSGFGLVIEAETSIYNAAQAEAQQARAGLWQGDFVTPAAWRENARVFADRPRFRPIEP
jgi:endonuclease YncB( thermonuclease family)